ncbi:MAG: NAD(P)-binding protein [Coriobacteriia bacterium]|nr:NAD(P)-binding protein [Coriobacteriia bacterium]
MSRLSVAAACGHDVKRTLFLESHERMVKANPPGACPIATQLSLLQTAEGQTCGKCSPCRVGIPRMAELMRKLLAYEGDAATVDEIRRRAQLLADTGDCLVGRNAGQLMLDGLEAFASEFESHINEARCESGTEQPVPCVAQCPAHVNVPAYIALVREGDCPGAVKMVRKDNPFPTACALICEHPCEQYCRRQLLDASLNIRGIKKYAVDNAAADTVETPKRLAPTGKRVAVIGGGPSGLTCAYFCALMGHDVTVFEGRKQLGGMMRYGIPAYRFPRARLDEDLNAILGVGGITVEYEHQVANVDEMNKIAVEYDAVYVAVGAQGGKTLRMDGSDAEGVMSAVQLLERIGDYDYPDFNGKNVVVVGGGNVAMDCARTSVRAGAASVTVAYRRRIEDMTALPEEVEAAIAEGVEMATLQAPVRVEVDDQGRAAALVCQPQMIGPVKGGRPAPQAASKPEVSFPADVVLIAVGQAVQDMPFGEFGMQTQRSLFVADEFLQAKGYPNVFVGGDCQTGPKTAIMAIAAGKVAAGNIDAYLGYHHVVDCGAQVPPARPNNLVACGRVQVAERPARERKNDFEYVELPMSAEEAAQECARCLRCDHYGIGAVTGRRLEQW